MVFTLWWLKIPILNMINLRLQLHPQGANVYSHMYWYLIDIYVIKMIKQNNSHFVDNIFKISD